MQKLILPINDLVPTAGYKNAAYSASWGYKHFGIDCISKSGNTQLYAMGTGKVIAAGLDGLNKKTTGKGSGCGYVLVIQYDGVHNHRTGLRQNLICTYMHMKELPKVKTGQTVTPKTLLGYYGNTGANTTGPHLHLQFDTDTAYPLYCSGLSVLGHNLLKAGTRDSTIDPLDVLHIGEGQTVHAASSKWYDAAKWKSLPTQTGFPKIVRVKVQSAPVYADADKKKRLKTVTKGNKYEVVDEVNGMMKLKSGGYIEPAYLED